MRWLLLIWLLVPHLAFAQVNVEALRSNGTEDGVAGSLGLTTAYTSGNILFADFGASATLEWKKNKDSVFFVMNHRFAAKLTQSDRLAEPDVGLWDEEAHFSNNRLIHLRYNRELSAKLWWELYSQYEYNEFLLLDRRLLVGTGPRFELVNTDRFGVWLGTSAMVEEESLNPDGVHSSEAVSRYNVRSSTYASITIRPSESVAWVSTGYAQPRIDDFNDHRLVAESGLTFAIGKGISGTMNVRVRHDSEPPRTPDEAAEIVGTDVALKNGLKFSF